MIDRAYHEHYEQVEAEADAHTKYNPWHPMTNARDLKTLGKLGEEGGELVSVVARCLIQGIDEVEPITLKPNRQWLEEELADVIASMDLTIEWFSLDREFITQRAEDKKHRLRGWHEQA